MKLILVRPAYTSHIITPPLGLGYLSSYIKSNGIEVKILDALRDGLNNEQILKIIRKEKPDAVGISCLTAFYNEVVRLSNMLKHENVRCIIGGVHPTFLPYSTLRDTKADFVICGEGEIALLKLINNNFQNDKIKGVYSIRDLSSDDDSIEMAEIIENLDEIPFPGWGQISPNTYPKAPHGAIVKNFSIGTIISTRGCPYECTFCASPRLCGRRIRFRSPENVVEEIKYLVKYFGVKEIHFEDDNLTFKREHIEKICNLIIQNKLKISWACPNGIRADKVDEALLRLMARSGCYYFAYGVESANPQILKNIKKHESIETITNSINLANKYGISCQGFFIFGLPGETVKTIGETINFARKSKLSRAQFLILDVIPGSQLWYDLKGKFKPDWSKNSFKDPEWVPEGLTEEQLRRAQARAFRSFYFRLSIIFRLALLIKLSQLKFLIQRFKEYRIFKANRKELEILKLNDHCCLLRNTENAMIKKTAIIIGAGPAGLTAAYEFLTKSDIQPIIYEMSGDIGGISKTIDYKGNRIDIGGHRFFSKSDKVIQWWLNIFPLQKISKEESVKVKNFTRFSRENNAPDPEHADRVMLIRNRISRIFFLRKFFRYPLSLNFETLYNLGAIRIVKIILSYLKTVFFPIREVKNLEDFFISRFGKELYLIFFKDYTHKVWGTPCKKISAEWGIQRVKGLSIKRAMQYALRKIIFLNDLSAEQKNIETSLIERFMYPKYGPGQLWQEVAKIIKEKGGLIYLNSTVIGLEREGSRIVEIKVKNEISGEISTVIGDDILSTMPVKNLIEALGDGVPTDVKRVANGLLYRDFITVGLLLRKLKLKNAVGDKTTDNIILDNWIYIQEKDVRLGRVQIFNNWSPYMVKDKNNIWIGLEYFCNVGDQLWSKSDQDIIDFAIDEVVQIGFIDKEDVLDKTVIRMEKVYPAYCGIYENFYIVKNFVNTIENLFLIGRNGMHRYNNTDHSMLTAMTAVENIKNGVLSKDDIWNINAEREYHEKK